MNILPLLAALLMLTFVTGNGFPSSYRLAHGPLSYGRGVPEGRGEVSTPRSPSTSRTVSTLTLRTRPISRTIYSSPSGPGPCRLGSLVMPLRLSVLT